MLIIYMNLDKIYYYSKYILLYSSIIGMDNKRVPVTIGKDFILNYDERDRSCPF